LAEALQVAPSVDQSVFAYLHTPAAVEKTRRILADEWPRLSAEAEAKADAANFVRLAHYVESSALLAEDTVLLEQCRRLSQAAKHADGAAECRSVLAEIGERIQLMSRSPVG
jgi:hypothetical protein